MWRHTHSHTQIPKNYKTVTGMQKTCELKKKNVMTVHFETKNLKKKNAIVLAIYSWVGMAPLLKNVLYAQGDCVEEN